MRIHHLHGFLEVDLRNSLGCLPTASLHHLTPYCYNIPNHFKGLTTNTIAINKIKTMNPENGGEQIRLRHSSLWRKPLTYEKPVPASNSCHHQLNELGTTGVSWRSRNNFVSTHSAAFRNKSHIPKRGNSNQLEELLSEKDKQSNLQRSLVKSLRPDAESIDRSAALLRGMAELQQLDLLKGKDLNKTKFPGIIRYNHIYNDYHERVANPGFSRNQLGKFFTK